MRAHEQEPYRGIRKTKWVFARKTYSELEDTTLATWQQWFPESVCQIKRSKPMHGYMSRAHPDGTTVELEIIFLALDQEEDVNKLRSYDLTGVWINEAKEIRKTHLDMATGRVNRFPHEGATWTGVIMDTNPPSNKHWWYDWFEVRRPSTWQHFRQPPAVLETGAKDPVFGTPLYTVNYGQLAKSHGIPSAENIGNLGVNYYNQQLEGKEVEWIKVNLCGEYGTTLEGKPIYPEYNDVVHVAKETMEIQRGLPVIVGMDFGLYPCAVMVQLTRMGQVRVIDELCGSDMALRPFVRDHLRPHMSQKYGGIDVTYVVDPGGNQREQGEGHTLLQILAEEGIYADTPSGGNRFKGRRDAVAVFLMSWRDDRPGFIINPDLEMIRTGFNGGYRYKTKRSEEGMVDVPEAEKNEYSHPHDALQYAVMAIRGGYYSAGGEVVSSASHHALPVRRGRKMRAFM